MIHEGFFNLGRDELSRSWESGHMSLHDFTKGELDSLIAKSNLVPTGKAHLMLVKKHYDFLAKALWHI
jgi:hypothetical protein